MVPNDSEFDVAAETTINDQIQSVEQLAERFIQSMREDQPASIEDYASSFPHLAQQIRELFPTILMMESARDQTLSTRIDGRVLKGPEPIHQLGDFKIEREIGRGGMGIVYQANQQSLDRRVAVKVLPRNKLTQRQLAIFEQESRVAAQLHHTNIVPIYGVGEHNGWHYFVMQFIDGRPLSRFVNWNHPIDYDPVVGETPDQALTIHQVCQIGTQVASAIQYAHQQGVLHRDIKPANLILDRQDKVWITDFGLAIRNSGPSITKVDSERTPGTLRYVPPEKLNGQADSPQGDVYALGITLIELVFGRPAFDFQNRQQLIERIQSGQFAHGLFESRPIHRDLYSVLMKAIAVDPKKRYRNAAVFADDLNRFLEDRPVSSQKQSRPYRFSRWLKRNPPLAISTAIIGFLLLTVSTLSTLGFFRVRSALRSERQHRLDAEYTSVLATGALDKVFLRFSPESRFTESDDSTDPIPLVLSDDDISLLENLLVYYQQLSRRDSANPVLAYRAVLAQCRVGEINERLGYHDEAAAAYRRALVDIGRLPQNQPYTIEKAKIYNQLGFVCQTYDSCYSSQSDDNANQYNARQYFELAMQALSDGFGDLDALQRQEAQLELARSNYYLGHSVRPGDGLNSLPPPFFGRETQGDDLIAPNLARVDNAIAILDELETKSEIIDARKRHLLSLCYREKATDQWQQWTSSDEQAHKTAVQLLESLINDFPNQTLYRYELMQTLAKIDVFEPAMERETLERAQQRLDRALEIGEFLIQRSPDVASFRIALVHAHFKLATICDRLATLSDDNDSQSLFDQSEQSYRQAVLAQTFLTRRYPQMESYRVWLAQFCLTLAQCPNLQNERQARQRLVGRAISLLVDLSDETKREPAVQALLQEASPLNRLESITSDE